MFLDLRHAVRVLLQTKAWTAVILLSLALGIGANTALFSGVNGLLLRTVPVPHPETLVRLRWAGQNDMRRSSNSYGAPARNASGEEVRQTTSYPIYQSLRAANQTLTEIAASAPLGNLNVIVDGEAELASAMVVSGNYFDLLQVPAEIGRVLTTADDSTSVPASAIISDAYWQKRFGGLPSTIGRTVTVNNTPVTIVGVTPRQFTGIQNLTSPPSDMFLPIAFDAKFSGNGGPTPRLNDATFWWVQMVGRLKPGVTFQQVVGNLGGPFQAAARDSLTSYLASIKPEERALSVNQNRTAVPHLVVDSAGRGIYDAREDSVKSARVLSFVVALLLVIVCANVANLLLSRGAARQKEISVRLSLGATRSRLVRQLLTESLLLSFIGGGLGILVGYWSRQLLPFASDAPMDWRVMSFSAILCVIVGVGFGLTPALRATGLNLSGAMQETSRNVSRQRTLLTKGLVVVQVAISLAVLIGAGLFVRTLQNLRSVQAGFNTRNLVVFGVNPRLNGYNASQVANLYDRLQQRLAAVPGIRGVAHSGNALLSGASSDTSMFIQGHPAAGPLRDGGWDLYTMTVSAEYLETLGIPMIRGRDLDVRDTLPNAPRVCVINETAARRFFPGEDPLGKRWGQSIEKSGEIEIVGIAADAKYENLRDPAPPTAFRPFAQQTTSAAAFVLRTASDPIAMMKATREAVHDVDPNLPIVRMSTQIDLIEQGVQQERFFALSYALFGVLALLLASIGLFGVMSYSVARRTNEIGIRMALGAGKRDVIEMVLNESLRMVAVGVVLGVAVALAAGRLIQTMLFGLKATDPATIGLAALTLVAVALLAGYLPGRRAARVDPLVALRYE
jgi:predicted permease